LSVKDPTVVHFEQRWHLFATTADTSGSWSMIYLNFEDWSEAGNAQPYYLDNNPALRGYHAAPQVFYFRPQKKWYLIFQSGQPQYSTTDDLSDPQSWSTPKDFFPAGEPAIVAENKGAGGWLDFWVICDSSHCHLFFTDDNGHLYRSQTTIDSFPEGFGDTEIAIDGTKETLFEGSATYRVAETGQYLTLVEAFGPAGGRYYRSFVADALDDEWEPLAASLDNPFAALSNVTFPNGVWTRDISHGELLRQGYDESLSIDPSELRFLYQGVDPAATDVEYFELPYRLALLTFGTHNDMTNGGAGGTNGAGGRDGVGAEASDGADTAKTLIDVVTQTPTLACYASVKQFLIPPADATQDCTVAENGAELAVSDREGSPPPSLRFEIPFTAYNQLLELEWPIPIEQQDLTGKRLVLSLKVVEPGYTNPRCPGGIRFFVKTGADYAYGSAPWLNMPETTSDNFRHYALDLENAELGSGVEALDLSFVRSVGLAFESADCGGTYPPGAEISAGTQPPSTASFFVDDILVEDAP
jgi:endo-1,4-beta-xylanase